MKRSSSNFDSLSCHSAPPGRKLCCLYTGKRKNTYHTISCVDESTAHVVQRYGRHLQYSLLLYWEEALQPGKCPRVASTYVPKTACGGSISCSPKTSTTSSNLALHRTKPYFQHHGGICRVLYRCYREAILFLERRRNVRLERKRLQIRPISIPCRNDHHYTQRQAAATDVPPNNNKSLATTNGGRCQQRIVPEGCRQDSPRQLEVRHREGIPLVGGDAVALVRQTRGVPSWQITDPLSHVLGLNRVFEPCNMNTQERKTINQHTRIM